MRHRPSRANFPEATFLCVDIQDLPTKALAPFVSESERHPLLFSACAPCQPFSRQRRVVTSSDDDRLGLLSHLLRFVREYRPELLFVENVPGLREIDIGRKAFDPFIQTLQRLGYHTETPCRPLPGLRSPSTSGAVSVAC